MAEILNTDYEAPFGFIIEFKELSNGIKSEKLTKILKPKTKKDCKNINEWNITTIYNVTEFHHLFNNNYDLISNSKSPASKSSAFESDIKSCGFTKKVNTIEWIKIKIATKLYKNFYKE